MKEKNLETSAEQTESVEIFVKKTKAESYMEGIFDANAKGFGFVEVEGLDNDLFVPQGRTGTAFDGDRVEVRLLPTFDDNYIPGGRDGKRQEAEVIRILERKTDHFVGTYEKRDHKGFVSPDNRKVSSLIEVKKSDSMKAVNGHKVVVQITDFGAKGRNPQGKIIEILGHMDDPGVDILSIIRAYDLPTAFPDRVMDQVRGIPQTVDYDGEAAEGLDGKTRERLKRNWSQREDWRDRLTVTIDGPDTKDIDDAISVEKTEKGWMLAVHIADVSNYVFEGTPLDKEALKRATSNYLVDRVIPMLPHELSNGICSLNPAEDRFALSCVMDLNAQGDVVDSRVVETVICSDAKLSYPGVMKLFEDKDESEIENQLTLHGMTRGIKTRSHDLAKMLRRGRKLSKILYKKRVERGSIEFESRECQILLDDQGVPTEIVPHASNEATEMIENFMLMANATVAQTFYWLELPFVYRTHGQPSEDKILQLSHFIRNYGYRLHGKGDVHPREIQQLLEKLKGTPEESMISMMALRSMQRAEYTTTCDGHFGLALKYYSHFTSPIRRYPDLQIHRIIKEYLHGKMNADRISHYEEILPDVCRQSSQMERRADEAERETDKQKKAEWMSHHLGESFEGVIDGITGWGFYVELPNTVEGLVPVASLTDDYYNFDEGTYRLVGERSGRTFELGQTVTVQAAAADTVTRTIDFALVIPEKAEKKRDTSGIAENGRPKKVRADGSPDLGKGKKESRKRGKGKGKGTKDPYFAKFVNGGAKKKGAHKDKKGNKTLGRRKY